MQVDGRVGGVVELLQDVAVGRLLQDLVSLGDRALHAVGAGGEDDFRAVGEQRHAALQAHGFGHGEEEPVALDCGHKRQRDAGVAAGGLNEHGFAGADFAPSFRVFDHGKADAVLDARRGVLAFQLGDYGSRKPGCHTVQPHQRSTADQFSYIRGNARHDDLLFPGAQARTSGVSDIGVVQLVG